MLRSDTRKLVCTRWITVVVLFCSVGLCLSRRQRQAVPVLLPQGCQEGALQRAEVQWAERGVGFGMLLYLLIQGTAEFLLTAYWTFHWCIQSIRGFCWSCVCVSSLGGRRFETSKESNPTSTPCRTDPEPAMKSNTTHTHTRQTEGLLSSISSHFILITMPFSY